MPRLTAAMTLILMSWLTPASTVAAGSLPPVRFSLDEHGAVIIPVLVNGLGPFKFLVDTGSSNSAISEAVATRVGASIVAKAEFITAAASGFRPVGQVERLTVGAVTADSFMATIIQGDELSEATAIPGLDGILGQNFLLDRTYTLNYRHRTLEWDTEPQSSHDVRLPLVSHDGRVLVELEQQGGTVVRLVPDSGSDGLVLFARNGVAPLTFDTLPGRGQLAALNGSTSATPVIVRQLTIGRMALRDQRAVNVSRDEANAPEGDGLLPLHHFSSVTFDASGYIVFRP